MLDEAYFNPDGGLGGYNFTMVEGEGLALYVQNDVGIVAYQNNCPTFDLVTGSNWVGTPLYAC